MFLKINLFCAYIYKKRVKCSITKKQNYFLLISDVFKPLLYHSIFYFKKHLTILFFRRKVMKPI